MSNEVGDNLVHLLGLFQCGRILYKKDIHNLVCMQLYGLFGNQEIKYFRISSRLVGN
jgi:hypothetical protein